MPEGMLGIFQEIVTLFAIVAVGYGAKKLRFMNDEFDRMLSKLVINIALPGMILGSVLTATQLPSAQEVWECLGLSFASMLIMFVVAYGFTLLLRIPDGHRGVYRFMLCFGNVGFIGYPVLTAVFGPDALVYAAVFNLPFNLFVFTVGAWFLTQDTDGVKVQTTWRTFVTPVMISCLIAIVLTLLGIHHAPILGDALNTLGSITTPAALLIIGSSLANMPARELLGSPRLWICSLFRLMVMPVLIWAVFSPFVPSGLMLAVTIMLTGMPVATNGTMLCYQYGGNSRVMAQGTFVTTVLALASIPLLATFVTSVL
ncbi:AEC family transporter [Adlercreutzia equolifaciens]|uniref:AEC family transporter n=1 Tax=Adlercreutzia equolifaciens TaxID=446660 RepID=UPI0023AF2843|nr:AEC family transporter [Adlercreutzia equolifaciens]MDE8702318.1 AEC family transporter [Adlercreutzia equolifaciens]